MQEADHAEVLNKKFVSAYLVKPVMQESIFELIVALFEDDIKDRKIKKEAGKPIINMEKYIMDAFKKSEEAYVQMEKIKEELMPMHQRKESFSQNVPTEEGEENALVLNVEKGLEKSKQKGVDYIDELHDFLETFDRSDVYFRDIAKSKAVWQIKEFAIDLEKKANAIGAERMVKLAEKISLLFVYDNLDMLPVYTGKYHLELKKLFTEIEKYIKRHA
ncbi:MAG: hypothetical protein L3J47_01545 [Sulfurovum sp.]|nr:hypothetical protein [Sulfurovum sp.]